MPCFLAFTKTPLDFDSHSFERYDETQKKRTFGTFEKKGVQKRKHLQALIINGLSNIAKHRKNSEETQKKHRRIQTRKDLKKIKNIYRALCDIKAKSLKR